MQELDDFIIIGSPKRYLEPNDDQYVQVEPKTKRLRQSELAKPIECPQCRRLFLDAIDSNNIDEYTQQMLYCCHGLVKTYYK